VEARGAEVIAAPGTSNREVVGTAAVGSPVEAVTPLTALAADNSVHVDDELVREVVLLVVAEVRSLTLLENLFCDGKEEGPSVSQPILKSS
jgi:hypothetical protein